MTDTPVVADDLTFVSTERLEADIKTLAGHLNAAMGRWLLMIAEYDRRRAYEHWECVSIEQWLSIHACLSASTARARVAVARRLVDLPLITAAFGRGELSYCKVRALCRVARTENEDQWLTTALHATGASLERLTADTRRALIIGQHGVAAQQLDERSLSWSWTDNGMCQLRGTLLPDTAALLIRLLAEHRETLDDRATSSEKADLNVRNADALHALLLDSATRPTFDDTSEAPRPLIVIHRDADGTSRIEGGPVVPNEVADEYACDAEHTTATHTADAVTYSPRRRHPTKTMRRHLMQRDRCCAFPGCGQRRNLHAHHIVRDTDGGTTDKENMVMLCPRHHGAVHRRGWTITGNPEAGTLTFIGPDGRRGSPVPQRVQPEGLVEENQAMGIIPTPRTAAAKNMGERVNHRWAVDSLCTIRPTITYPPPINRFASAEANQRAHTTAPV
jgi:Domain of unknown function (DUF222)/HNH endonuclease